MAREITNREEDPKEYYETPTNEQVVSRLVDYKYSKKGWGYITHFNFMCYKSWRDSQNTSKLQVISFLTKVLNKREELKEILGHIQGEYIRRVTITETQKTLVVSLDLRLIHLKYEIPFKVNGVRQKIKKFKKGYSKRDDWHEL